MATEKTSQILIFPRPDYNLAEIASALGVLPDSIWAITDEKSIKIDTIRRLQQELSTAPAGTTTRQVVLFPAESITQQAQQALLKLIEEPPINTQITLVTASASQVLQTIQSRCVVKVIQPTHAHSTHQLNAQSSIFSQFTTCRSWGDVVTLSQKLPTKREELREILREEYQQKFPQTELAVIFQETLGEVLLALESNVQPALCTEKLLFTPYQHETNKKAAE